VQPSRNLGSVTTADGRELVLYMRDGVYTIRVGGLELMSSRAHGSEEELARLACSAMPPRPQPSVLIGGLGMGFTVHAALSCLPPEARVVVCEVFPAVMAWNRGPLADVAGRPLEDPRVRPVVMDVADLIEASARGGRGQSGSGPFDAILLDVDNGPEPFTLGTNRRLYDRHGVVRLRDALAAGGVLALWSASPDEAFERRLGAAGFEVGRHTPRARPGTRGPRHTIYLARRTRD